jgi:uncharacterized protein (TIGR00255 family)
MTGFARVRETIDSLEVVISVKSVNHRGLDIHFYTGAELDPFEAAMRGAVKRHLSRGHIDVRAQLSRAGATGPLSVDQTRLAAYVEAFRAASEQHRLSGDLDLNVALRLPGMLSDSAPVELEETVEQPLVALLERALEALNQFRTREGNEIAALMVERAAAIHSTAIEIENLRRGAMPAFQTRLRERMSDLLAGANIEPQRLVQEAALLADRSDVGEEIERLKIHSKQAEEILMKGGEVGKKLDFMLQEMNRETNTILSKTSGLGEPGLRITELAVAAKSDIEKLREQSLNLE